MMRKLKCIIWSLIALQGLTVAEKTCQKGTHISKDGERCVPCINGINYTSYSNAPFCSTCTKCDTDQIAKSPCTTTQNTKCECKPGKFIHKKDSPEKCNNCTRCPEGISEVRPCTPWSDTQCANQKTFQPSGTVDNNLGQSSSPCNFSISTLLIFVAAFAVVLVCLSGILLVVKYRSSGYPDCFKDRIFVECRRILRAPEALNNDTNNHYEMETLNGNSPLDTMVCEQELENQPLDPLIAQEVQSQGEVEQVPIGAKQRKRKCLVPVKGTNITESLHHLFNNLYKIVPVHSWRPLMRRMGLTDNEICIAEKRASDQQDGLYEMLVTWHSKKGMKASVNTLLDALEAQGERAAKEEIQYLLLNSGKFIYEDDRASYVMPM